MTKCVYLYNLTLKIKVLCKKEKAMNQETALKDLEFIKNIMADAQKKVYDNGVGLIGWGILVTIGLISTYIGIVSKYYFVYAWNWVVVVGIGWAATIVHSIKHKKLSSERTFGGKILSALWIAGGVAMTLIGFVGTSAGAYSGVYISPLISIILGIMYFVTGAILGKKWVSYLSIGWWLGAIIMFVWPYLYTLLFMAALIILLQIIPGIIFFRESRARA